MRILLEPDLEQEVMVSYLMWIKSNFCLYVHSLRASSTFPKVSTILPEGALAIQTFQLAVRGYPGFRWWIKVDTVNNSRWISIGYVHCPLQHRQL